MSGDFYAPMIALSSHRPFKGEPEYRRNQLRAKASWERIFNKIIYVGVFEPDLMSDKTEIIESADWPTMEQLFQVAGWQRETVCLVNADIVLTPTILQVEELLMLEGVKALTSRRYTFNPAAPDFEKAKVGKDLGFDIFIADPDVWQKLCSVVPDDFRIGHNQWDTWLLYTLQCMFKERCRDFTGWKCVFHPQHSGRKVSKHKMIPKQIPMTTLPAPVKPCVSPERT